MSGSGSGSGQGFRFLDLPLEIRLQVYGHYLKEPEPFNMWPGKKWEFTGHVSLAYICRQFYVDTRGIKYNLRGRENVFALNYEGPENLSDFVPDTGTRRCRSIRHIRFTWTDYFEMNEIISPFISRDTEFYQAAWLEGGHDAFNWALRRYYTANSNRDMSPSMPSDINMSMLSRRYFPNLTTLTIDIRHIDQLVGPRRVYWLQAPSHIRDQCYRVVVEHVRRRLPSDVAHGLSITLHAVMSPKLYADQELDKLKIPRAIWSLDRSDADRPYRDRYEYYRPVLHITMVYDARGDGPVQLVERLSKWKTLQIRTDGENAGEMDVRLWNPVVLSRVMPWSAPKEQNKDAQESRTTTQQQPRTLPRGWYQRPCMLFKHLCLSDQQRPAPKPARPKKEPGQDVFAKGFKPIPGMHV